MLPRPFIHTFVRRFTQLMRYFTHRMALHARVVRLAAPICGAVLPLLWVSTAQSQSFCASDGQVQPTALHERFISAECADCWGATPSVQPGRHALVLDWIVPSPKGDDAPLSAAATRDALDRIEGLMAQPPSPTHATVHTTQRRPSGLASSRQRLRLAHGLPFNNYVGTSIRYQASPPAHNRDLVVWQVLVETIPAGIEGTPIERNLVRNTLIRHWQQQSTLSKSKQFEESDSRPMSIPEGAKAERLRLVGWIEDASGHVLTATQTKCIVESTRKAKRGKGS